MSSEEKQSLDQGTFHISTRFLLNLEGEISRKAFWELVRHIPRETQLGKVYKRLITATRGKEEDFADAILRVYNHTLCKIIDNYHSSAYYEPSYVIARAFCTGSF